MLAHDNVCANDDCCLLSPEAGFTEAGRKMNTAMSYRRAALTASKLATTYLLLTVGVRVVVDAPASQKSVTTLPLDQLSTAPTCVHNQRRIRVQSEAQGTYISCT